VFIIIFITSCVSLNNSGSSQFNGKFLISKNNLEPSTFNINVNIFKNMSIIQLKKPFYGNVLKIEMSEAKKTIFVPQLESETFNVPDYLDENFKHWLKDCVFKKELYIFEQVDEINFKFKCNKEQNRTNFFIEYSEFKIEGFLL
tara:strand:+ start:70 stop:501 length:432 start_codon:yes stop_codon:yes gene_type:complete